MLHVTRMIGRGKVVFVVCALTRRWQPCLGEGVYHLSSTRRDTGHVAVTPSNNSSNNSSGSSSNCSHSSAAAANVTADRGKALGCLRQKESGPQAEAPSASDGGATQPSLQGDANTAVVNSTTAKAGVRRAVTKFVGQFMQGTKLLWAETGLARELAARKKAGEALSFQEDRLLRQVIYTTSCTSTEYSIALRCFMHTHTLLLAA